MGNDACLEKYIHSLGAVSEIFNRSSGREQGFKKLSTIAEYIGFPYIICAPVQNHPLADKNWSITTYPKSWQDIYLEKNYIKRNPVRNRSLVTARAFTWSDLEREIAKEERIIFTDARSCGMADAVVIPIHGPWGQVVAIGFATDSPSAITPQTTEILQILATRFNYTFNEDLYISSVRLTDREREILEKVSIGYGSYQIANLLGISENSIGWHMKNIFVKLCVKTRTAAVVKAVQLGLIHV